MREKEKGEKGEEKKMKNKKQMGTWKKKEKKISGAEKRGGGREIGDVETQSEL